MRFLYLVFSLILCCQVSCSKTSKEIKIGFVEGLSGPFANIGEVALRHLELEVEAVNRRGSLPDGMRITVCHLIIRQILKRLC